MMFPKHFQALALVLVSTFPQLGISADPPNLIVIMTDDMGYADVGFNVRSGEHKLVVFEKTGFQSLYNLQDDISESKNLVEDQPGIQQRLAGLWKDWNEPNIEPAFAGLIMGKAARNANPTKPSDSKDQPAEKSKKSAEYWKNQFFKRHPDSDSNQDGRLSWPEYQAAKDKLAPKKNGKRT